jgi:acyl-CoA thioester hydrolase
MGVVHHSVYPVWMEMARTEMLRAQGLPYSRLEEQGMFFVVARMGLRYRKPARYDEELRVLAWVSEKNRARIDHVYEIRRGRDLLVTAQTTLACVDRDGRIRAIPEGV